MSNKTDAVGSSDTAGTSDTATLTSTDPVLAAFADDVGDSGPVAVVGRRTRWDLGGAPTEETRLLEAPSGVVEYKPDEMTVTVRAGTTVSELHAVLAEEGQRSALPDRGGTVGGALAVGESDVRALGRGLIRTSLLQIRYVSAEGRIVSSGGPTVKNVSGFDLPRLMVGSLGTLGLLAEAIIRTNPIPSTSRWLVAEGVDPVMVQDVLLAPSAILWDGSSTWVQIEGHEADVDAQHRALAPVGTFTEIPTSGRDALPMTLPAHRWSVAPAEIPNLDRATLGGFVAAVGLGLVFAGTPQPARSVTAEVKAVSDRVKQNFDPTGRLNPGRDAGRK